MSKRSRPEGEEEVPAGDAAVTKPDRPEKRKGYRSRMQEGRAAAAASGGLPQKKWFRQRAHCNPLSFNETFDSPLSPAHFDTDGHYPSFAGSGKRVEVADIGCGFGGLLVGLSPLLPGALMMGMEIRTKVTEYVRLRILALRDSTPGEFGNVSVIRTNAMKYLPNYFAKGQLSKMFFCFPDPHFKAKNHRRRIISAALLDEYAYCLREGGILYTITDVPELNEWMVSHCSAHPAFARIPQDELAADPCYPIMMSYTEEGKKVERNAGPKLPAAFRRVSDAAATATASSTDFWEYAEADTNDGGEEEEEVGDDAVPAAASGGAGAEEPPVGSN